MRLNDAFVEGLNDTRASEQPEAVLFVKKLSDIVGVEGGYLFFLKKRGVCSCLGCGCVVAVCLVVCFGETGEV